MGISTQANVMLAYSIPEAENLLESKLTAAQQSLDNCEEDLDFLREQITVSQHGKFPVVNISTHGNCLICTAHLSLLLTKSQQTLEVATARVYNWDVAQRRKDKEGGEGLIEAGKTSSPNG
jgi:hypothetical protein